ncbi:MAG: DUF3298 and DUF4163 domain-containing protein [Syntrophomonadaceae bacterium]
MNKIGNIVDMKEIAGEMRYDGVTVLSYRIEYPYVKSSVYKSFLGPINQFYKNRALKYQYYCQTKLFAMAVEQYLHDKKSGYPERAYDATLTNTITYNSDCIISLYSDRYEFTGGAHGSTVRSSQTWNLQNGQMLRIGDLFNTLFNYRRYIINEVIRQIRENPEPYFENYETLVEQYFDPNSFYCTPNGLVVYYQQYEIAPYASGIREFLLPYNQNIQNPINKCR